MKKVMLLMVVLTAIIMGGCGNTESTNATQEQPPVQEESQTEEIQEENNDSSAEKIYGIGDTWEVDGQWELTINSVKATDKRNKYADEKPKQVVFINYVYKNIGYVDEDEIMDGLFFDLSNEQIVDSKGDMGYEYPNDIKRYPQEAPVGARCKAQACIGTDHKGEIKIICIKYDGKGNEHTATFILPVEKKDKEGGS